MKADLADDQNFMLVSDSAWKTSPGPITYNDFCNGETYDARLEQQGWNQPSFNDSLWKNATLAEPPGGHSHCRAASSQSSDSNHTAHKDVHSEGAGILQRNIYL